MIEDKIISFFDSLGITRGCNITLRVYEYGKYCKCISYENAILQFTKDYEEMKDFLSAYIPDISDRQVFEKTANIWKKYLVLFNKE